VRSDEARRHLSGREIISRMALDLAELILARALAFEGPPIS